ARRQETGPGRDAVSPARTDGRRPHRARIPRPPGAHRTACAAPRTARATGFPPPLPASPQTARRQTAREATAAFLRNPLTILAAAAHRPPCTRLLLLLVVRPRWVLPNQKNRF